MKKFGVPPFSVLDTRKGYWQDRKRKWKGLGIKSEVGRNEHLAFAVTAEDIEKCTGHKMNYTGTSIFDPVLAEIMYRWFCPEGGNVFDCFAGGSVRGVVADFIGYHYIGIELREEQVEANRENADDIGVSPVWICDDSRNVDEHIEDESVDMVFSCPPYADLEVYSDDQRDLSTMEYEDFLSAYREIIQKAVKKLKQNRFAVFVVADVRNPKGFYRGFVKDTQSAFEDAGAYLYNDIVLVNQIGSGIMRAGRSMRNRKTVYVHQHVLVFYKGDPKKISENFGDVSSDYEIDDTWINDEE